ncbi:MAG: methylenetetrahydrofolate--tRNA-(uracil(54)-C(5))-methyltransferase (FADH(2)-oxidizing) TrmFO [Clostridiales bacterium]|nr:methylenetetrahydrofolate--tRNA-(uracil(54)-C(5))-methyltransferase (FADH(2)-oxidizing) TrmFO [Clostridiales bacterium]
MATINVIGAGLAGSEAAHIAASLGVNVRLYEMKPVKYSPAHHSEGFAELVCSNSLRADSVTNAVGLLKEELRMTGSLIMEAADKARVPAGGALAVDREEFSNYITDWIRSSDKITVINEEITKIPDDDEITVIATGPLTDGALFDAIAELCGDDTLHFFDAAAPIVMGSSIDMSKAFRASRYDKGGDDYINCPMNKDEYLAFYHELITAERAAVKDFDREIVFEGCMPIETMASRGEDTMRFGPLKPVGLIDPSTGKEPYACLQLRQDDRAKTMYNLVGFQTRLKWDEQKRVFGMIPGLENAEYYRMGVMHRNTYLNSPSHLDDTYKFRTRENLFFAGQMTGVEGYIESTASGFLAGYYAALKALGREVPYKPGADTVMGAMAAYVSDPNIKKFVPMNANFGIVAPMPGKFKGRDGRKQKYQAIADRSITEMAEFAGVLEDLRKG